MATHTASLHGNAGGENEGESVLEETNEAQKHMYGYVQWIPDNFISLTLHNNTYILVYMHA